MIYALIVIETLLAVAAQLMLRSGAVRMNTSDIGLELLLEPIRNPFILGGLALHGLSFFLYIFILSKIRLNLFYPLATGASIVLLTALSIWLLEERLTPTQGAGMVAILAGVFLLFREI